MIENIFVSVVIILICAVFQGVIVSILLNFLIYLDLKNLIRTSALHITFIISLSLIILVSCNLVQIGLWASVFRAYGEFEDFSTAFYHSTVNFTTLGYGDIVLSPERRLLGAVEAMNGLLMFGLTTATIFAVLQNLMQRRLLEVTAKNEFSDQP